MTGKRELNPSSTPRLEMRKGTQGALEERGQLGVEVREISVLVLLPAPHWPQISILQIGKLNSCL